MVEQPPTENPRKSFNNNTVQCLIAEERARTKKRQQSCITSDGTHMLMIRCSQAFIFQKKEKRTLILDIFQETNRRVDLKIDVGNWKTRLQAWFSYKFWRVVTVWHW